MPNSEKFRLGKRSPKRSLHSDATETLTTKARLATWRQKAIAKHWRLAVSAVCMTLAAGAVSLDIGLVNLWERQVQSLFFEVRGPVESPDNIVILAIDEESLSQGQHYAADPTRLAYLKPIESWPWQRRAYAQVIERLMDAGAQAVAIDVLFIADSSYGDADDEAFAEVLSRHSERIVLAADYSPQVRQYGVLSEPSLPIPLLEETGVHIGSINFRKEPNEQIHRLGQEFLRELALYDGSADSVEAAAVASETSFEDDGYIAPEAPPLSFAQATLKAANISYPEAPRENIFFHGPRETFKQVPFWQVIDDDLWRNHLRSGAAFKDKIVIIGTTAAVRRDFHEAPFSQSMQYPYPMAGVEILANTIATLEKDLSPRRLVKNSGVNAIAVLSLGMAIALLAHQTQKPVRRALIIGGGIGAWTVISYGAFVAAQTILMTGTPVMALALMGLLDFGLGFGADRLKRNRLRTTLARYATSPLVQEIISQQDDFQDLLALNRADIIGTVLRDRYQILEVLGAGGFGETYRSKDTQRPGNPVCVVKQLKIVSDNPKSHHLARRLFEAEAVVLGELGEHDQIPRLLAYFEVQQTFYLVQEMIKGDLLRDVLSRSRPLSQKAVANMLRDLLPVIRFVHSRGVIHRDIKPSNIIRRKHDGRYVLIDFGAVKTISNKLNEADETRLTSTVGIGTQGYMPSEQSAGMPTIRSDIYALGITAIEALTGKPPHALKRSDDGEIIWSHTVDDMSPTLSKIINKMVRFDFNNRYENSDRVIEDLSRLDDEQLTDCSSMPNNDYPINAGETLNQGTRPGVIDTNSALENTQILPENWINDAKTCEEPPSEEVSDEA
ncbi:MAG: serine/threonine-protein kinase [Cyanobacteria bacterium J06627_28]